MISIQNLGKQFQNKWIFRHIDLEIQKKESIVFIGPSGSGKSVLLKLIGGLLSPSEGKIQVQSTCLGMLFQKNALFDSLTVEENLLFPLKEVKKLTGSKAKEKVDRFLSAVQLKGTESLYPDEISGGMQKRLGIARALIVEPEIILYDEPTAGLDPITSRTIANMIAHLREEIGSTLITVTNDMQRAYQLGDQIYLLAKERLTLGGSSREIQVSKNPFIHQFIYGLTEGPLTSQGFLQ